jgi:recombination protein RecA
MSRMSSTTGVVGGMANGTGGNGVGTNNGAGGAGGTSVMASASAPGGNKVTGTAPVMSAGGQPSKPDGRPDGKSDGKSDAAMKEVKGPGASGVTAAAPGGKPGAPVAAGAAAGKPAVAKKPEQTEEQKAKRKALELTVGQIEKTFGKGSIMKMDEAAYLSIQGISTGSLSLDLALGGKGIPRGRIIEVFGPESSGKTTLALTIAAHAQKEGGVAAVIDAEHALDPSWARKLGVNIDDLLVSQPDTGEQALEICELLVRSNAVEIIIIDSVAALVPRAEIEGEMGDASMGLQARLMSQAMRKLTGIIARSNCTVVFINQIREKIGVMFGSPETTTGGRALKFYASVRIDVRRTGAIKDGDVTIGSRTRARVVKNKVAPPFRDAEFDIMYDEGISASGDLIDLAVDAKVVAKSGSWFSYGDVRVGQGREASKQFLRDNPELFKEIRQKVLDVRLAQPIAAGKPAADDDTDEGDPEGA